MKKLFFLFLVLTGAFCSIYGQPSAQGNTMITINNRVSDIVNHRAFSGYGVKLLPWNNGRNNLDLPIRNIASLMPYHQNIRPEEIIASLNYMINEVNQGKTVYYDIYSAAQIEAEYGKGDTGLFFFRGEPGAPFILLIPGGGFNYVGSLHEGFPLAVEIAKKGYNAFVIKYRPPGEYITVDTAAALSFIFANAASLNVAVKDYSIWGFSAGGKAVSEISLNGPSAYGASGIPKPCTAGLIYTQQPHLSQNDPAAFIAIGEDDRIVNAKNVESEVKKSREAGADIEFHLYRNINHGFGLGTGTNAEGWLDNAVRHWERHIRP